MPAANQNQFIVDLGPVKLSEAQRASMNSAIQRAAAAELAGVGSTAGRIVLIPADKWKIGPIVNGIVARPINDDIFNKIIGV
jgi:hypothetical protein